MDLPQQDWWRQIGGLLTASLCGREPTETGVSSSFGDFLKDKDFLGDLESVKPAGAVWIV